MTSRYMKSNFEAIIFDFVKTEQSIYIILNSKNMETFKSIGQVLKYRNDLKIVNEVLEEYYSDCNSFFEKKISPLFSFFLNKLSDKLISYSNEKPTIDNKKEFFNELLDELSKKPSNNINRLTSALEKYRD